ncbi:hypothetical protein LCGC14_1487590 [marine sediment metagenome]|uniref:Uncharacterized protein n=1 Tax=marine sediment metagenome TaxID=412755 RepID=A0A0F9J8H0_9ZZZZ
MADEFRVTAKEMTKQEKIREGDWAVELDRRESITQWLEALVGNEKAVGILSYLDSQGVVIKDNRDNNNKYLLAEFYTSKMPTAVDNPDIECGFYKPIVAVESLIREE